MAATSLTGEVAGTFLLQYIMFRCLYELLQFENGGHNKERESLSKVYEIR